MQQSPGYLWICRDSQVIKQLKMCYFLPALILLPFILMAPLGTSRIPAGMLSDREELFTFSIALHRQRDRFAGQVEWCHPFLGHFSCYDDSLDTGLKLSPLSESESY
jgi:hypothetical protein